jgi:hypothetical protein
MLIFTQNVYADYLSINERKNHNMKKLKKNNLLAGFAATALTAVLIPSVFVNAESLINITFRVEGVSGNLYYDTVSVPDDGNVTVQKAIEYIDSVTDNLTVTGADSGYITDINGQSSGMFGGWDGWFYNVNGENPSVGIDGFTLKSNDNLVLFYADYPYQNPVADTTKIKDGILKFTSSDTVYDDNWNASIVVNPVANATVTWYYGEDFVIYKTDNNGQIKIDSSQLSEGSHRVQIEKYNKQKIVDGKYSPTVLRFAPDYMITVNLSETATQATVTTTSETVENIKATETSQTQLTDEEKISPDTGDSLNSFIFASAIISVALLAFSFRKMQIKNNRN